MFSEQRIRQVLFYLSVFIFLVGLPFILSFALGYKFDWHGFKFTKTGLIDLVTQPPGALVRLDGKLLDERTPSAIQELLPGTYRVAMELKDYYPWEKDIHVEAGKVTRLDKIIFFPLRPNIKQLNEERVSSFWMDSAKSRLYYLDYKEGAVYESDSEGEDFQKTGSLSDIGFPIKEWKVSPDRGKLVCFNQHKIAVVYLNEENDSPAYRSSLLFDYPRKKISDIFWHSDSFHFILVTDKSIEVQEASANSIPVNLVNLNIRNTIVVYDGAKDSLYFLDSEKAPDGKFYDNIYKLDLGTKFSPLKDLINLKPSE